MEDRRTVILYDSGHAHTIVRILAAAIAMIAAVVFFDVAASCFGCDFFKADYPRGKPLALVFAFALAWFCAQCAVARKHVFYDSTSKCLVMRSPGFIFRKIDVFIAASNVVRVVVRYVHGPLTSHYWNVEWIDNAKRRHWLIQSYVEYDAREAARRIGEAIGKPVE
jgi:hypothetical protein